VFGVGMGKADSDGFDGDEVSVVLVLVQSTLRLMFIMLVALWLM
jgi:hypothetical protein